MKKKYKVMLLIIGILLAIALATGSSYAYWIYTAVQSGSNTASSDCFALTFTDANDIHLDNTIPMSESEGKELVPYTFTIKNVCNHAADYDVNMETLSNSTLDVNYLRYKIDNKKSKILGDAIEVDTIDYVNSNTIKSNNIANGTLESNEEKTFNLRIWIDEDSTVDQSASKTYESKVVVIASLNAHYSSAMLVEGRTFNAALKRLANSNDSNITSGSVDYKIKHIIYTGILPNESVEKANVSTSEEKPVYAWFDTDTIYLYSKSNRIYMNKYSYEIFDNFLSLEDIDLSKFDTSKVANMSGMFQGSKLLQSLDFSTFDTSNVTSMSAMFSGCQNIVELDLSSFDTSKVTDMSMMFYAASKLQNINLSTFDTSKVEYMSAMFREMKSIQVLDLSSFDTSSLKYTFEMFQNSNIKTIYVSNKWNASSFKNSNSMFYGSYALVGGAGTKYNSEYTNEEYARIDDPDNGKPGYFTLKTT